MRVPPSNFCLGRAGVETTVQTRNVLVPFLCLVMRSNVRGSAGGVAVLTEQGKLSEQGPMHRYKSNVCLWTAAPW